MRRHYWGVFAVEMGVFFGDILEVIAKHFIFEKSILFSQRVRLLAEESCM